MHQWYVINTFSGQEAKVKRNLEHRFSSNGLTPRLRQVLIPTETIVEQRADGTRVEKEQVRMPGYLFLELDLNDVTWTTVIDTPGVTGFVGAEGNPSALSASERERMLGTTPVAEAHAPGFAIGDEVAIIAGPLAEFTGVISEVNAEQRRVKVLVSIFGRETPAELGYEQVQATASA